MNPDANGSSFLCGHEVRQLEELFCCKMGCASLCWVPAAGAFREQSHLEMEKVLVLLKEFLNSCWPKPSRLFLCADRSPRKRETKHVR